MLLVRKLKGKEHSKRYVEKLGYGYSQRPKGEVIWVHALGLGETLALTLFLKMLSQSNKDKTILFTSSTLHSFIAFNKIVFSKNLVHQFAPIDNISVVRRFLNYWKPSTCLISEIDLWPIRIIETKKYGVDLFLFNSRMNKKKRNDRAIFSSVIKKTLSSFDAIYLQDEESKSHFQFFGVPSEKLFVCGAFKSAGSYVAKDPTLIEKLNSWSKNKLVWIAASIHEDEEPVILEAFSQAKLVIPNLNLIIVPRNLDLISKTKRRCQFYSQNYFVRRLKNQFPKTDTEILIITTVGEMGSLYNQSDIAFIGNSMKFERIKTGKNPFEAIQEKCVVIHGPKMLEPSYSEIYKRNISEVVNDKDDIVKALERYTSVKERKIKIEKGQKFLKSNRYLIERFLKNVMNYNKKGTR